MRILFADESAAAERFSSTEARNVMMGSGAASARMMVNGTPFANDSAMLAALRSVPASVSPIAGSVTVSAGSSVTINAAYNDRNPVCCCEGQSNAVRNGSNDEVHPQNCNDAQTLSMPELAIGGIDLGYFVMSCSNGGDVFCPGASANGSYAYI